ncbi:MAG TPA: thioredoxin domain-containing protein [Nannocystaceae bacterium]|nr:thioredoxin domain-containing protein [Nannocystaceae bacterium]
MFALGAVAACACSPACTAPEALSPDSTAASTPAPKEPSAREKQRAELPKEDIREARGVVLDELAESQRETFFQIINSEPSACGKPHSIAHSLRDDPTCRDSMLAAQFVADAIGVGATTTVVREKLEEVVASLQVRQIPTEGRPVWGSENAPITVVEFADFTCPHCRQEAPKIRKAVDQFRGRVKLVFKYFPLEGPGHERGRPAAIAAEAAHEQGKFWEMHDQIFAHQDALEDKDLMSYAQNIGLDMAKFRASYEAKKGEARVEADRKDGDKIEIHGTPAVFVNGREVSPLLFGGDIVAWIDDAMKR